MTQTAIVNYHVHKPSRQAFELDAGGIPGNLISPELVSKKITLRDDRTNDAKATFKADSVEFAARASSVKNIGGGTDWQPAYNKELTRLLKDKVDAKEVVIFDHTIRTDDPDADRKPARNVHSDYSSTGAKQRLVDILGTNLAADWSNGHYAFINIWRPLEATINSAPLGFVMPQSVANEDWILLDLIYPDRKGQILGLAANPKHEWIYRSSMTPDDVVIFNIYDNRGQPAIAHSALDRVENSEIKSIRKSIESRTLVRY
ncbi:CmcJ/NvfI family oxidoreductase [Cognatishimia sp. WU-CL00825]|uniref:CmcJ/NvfI family oxidoreductase n=1 Tax=Cognatishimia sp. WU-CL00825 TaxID=3127658 RepID=UPI0031021474